MVRSIAWGDWRAQSGSCIRFAVFSSEGVLKSMTPKLDDYELRVWYDLEAVQGGAFMAEVIGWDWVKGDGQTPEEAVRMCREVLEIYIECKREAGEPLPPPGCGARKVPISLWQIRKAMREAARPGKNTSVRRNGKLGGRPRKKRELVAA